ncbi:MAG: P-loop NTPase [Candidatus Aegiribacteria sp.]|nr:P-loop NTPase [Candidatus Aegiribacteria sp.]MBD3294377.1 P-loop NTPase [Candidatus Fermentibacteria bacterium]
MAENRAAPFSLKSSPAENSLLVLSGKGGVGKSTVAANIAVALSLQGYSTGLLDTDFHGPTIPKLLGLEGTQLTSSDGKKLDPAELGALKVISVDFMLGSRTDPVIWRGPMKMNVIKQLFEDVHWGDLQYMVVDCPPGTGDEPLSVVQLIPEPTGAVIVTTPQEVSLTDVRRSIQFCRALKLPVLGVIENMSGFVCPHCGERTELFGSGGGEKMAQQMDVPFLGRIPIEPEIVESGEKGKPFVYHNSDSPYASDFENIVTDLVQNIQSEKE